MGQTMSPNYFREEQSSKSTYSCMYSEQNVMKMIVLVSKYCPKAHPYAYASGSLCCSSWRRDPGCLSPARTHDDLDFEDDVTCCPAGASTPCPSYQVNPLLPCKSWDVVDSANMDLCPEGHKMALALASKCCSEDFRSPSCPKNPGSYIEWDDPEECCGGTIMDCPSMPYQPCKGCYALSQGPMSHSQALTWCEARGWANSGIVTQRDLDYVYHHFRQELMKADLWSVMKESNVVEMSGCDNAACNDKLLMEDGVTLYNYESLGNLSIRANQGLPCMRLSTPNVDGFPLNDKECEDKFDVMCRVPCKQVFELRPQYYKTP
jgi:hypothetical protein